MKLIQNAPSIFQVASLVSRSDEFKQTRCTDLVKRAARQLSVASTLFVKRSRLMPSELQLQKLTRYLIHVQEEERRRIARDLHDDIGQRIALLKIELETALSSDLLSGGLADAGRYREILTQLEELGTDVQQLSHRLHSSKLGYLGLKAALKELCDRIKKQQRISVCLEAADLANPIAAETELCFYRVAQEGLHNVTKHSGADTVTVKLFETKASFQMEIRDNGKGFNYAESTEGLGLASMRERLKMVGGDLQVKSGPGRGTTLIAWRRFSQAFTG